MFLNEELLTDEGYRRAGAAKQLELIAGQCADIEERIRTASSRHEALRIAESACAQFDAVCPSSLVRTALAANVQAMIERYWSA